jgi:rare lipoprotein A
MGLTLFTLRLIAHVVTTVLSSVTLHPRAGLAAERIRKVRRGDPNPAPRGPRTRLSLRIASAAAVCECHPLRTRSAPIAGLIVLAFYGWATLPAPITPAPSPAPSEAPSRGVVGLASWYGAWHHGRLTAAGEVYDMRHLTAAHRRLPFGTWLLVTRVDDGRSVVVRVTDRGPYVPGRVIDLSRGAAKVLGMLEEGVVRVRVVVLEDAA